jgi:hypothetical protein
LLRFAVACGKADGAAEQAGAKDGEFVKHGGSLVTINNSFGNSRWPG